MDLTNGSISKNLIWLSYPIIIAMILQTCFNVVDMIFVGRISSKAIASVSAVFPIIFLVMALSSGLSIGNTSVVSRYVGSKDYEKASNIALHSILLALIFSLVITSLSLKFSIHLFRFMGMQNFLNTINSYFNIIASFFVFIIMGFIFNSILRGEGDTRTGTKAIILAIILNTILDPIFIFGFKLGVKGAALATVIARAFSCIFMATYLFKGKGLIKLNLSFFKFDINIIKAILKIGVPASLVNINLAIAALILIKIVSFYGTDSIAAFGIASRLDSIVVLPAIGLASAVITLTGQNIGASKHSRARKSTFLGVLFSTIFMGLIGLIFFLTPRFLAYIFTSHIEVITLTASYLRIVSLTYPFIGLSLVIGAGFQGAGKGMPTLVITIIKLYILNIPLAYFLSQAIGVNGIWLSIAISNIVSGIVALFWFNIKPELFHP